MENNSTKLIKILNCIPDIRQQSKVLHSLVDIIFIAIVVIDSKTMCSTYDSATGKKALHIVSAWFSEIGQEYNINTYQNYDKGHGRIELRTYYITSDIRWMDAKKNGRSLLL
ncbi:hypothetical protein [Tepidanaerobacter syntrophicus]|uniref:hypothetical protein n=1 Tax=Tepidanaerobacter syntrophicus TaxID=224999 RepID=UPI001BD57887|nr:hypothetical protein [Tepidanaerobacter syntrophicus]